MKSFPLTTRMPPPHFKLANFASRVMLMRQTLEHELKTTSSQTQHSAINKSWHFC